MLECTCGGCDSCGYRQGAEDAYAERDAQGAKIKMIKTINMFVRPPGEQQYRLFECTYQFEDDLTNPQIKQVMREIHDIYGSINITDATPTETIKSRGTDVLVMVNEGVLVRFTSDIFVSNADIVDKLLADGDIQGDTIVRLIPTPRAVPFVGES